MGPFSSAVKKVVFYAAENTQGYLQAVLQSRSLTAAGRVARVSNKFDPVDLARSDLLVFTQPNLSGELISGINTCIQNDKPYAVAHRSGFSPHSAGSPGLPPVWSWEPGFVKSVGNRVGCGPVCDGSHRGPGGIAFGLMPGKSKSFHPPWIERIRNGAVL